MPKIRNFIDGHFVDSDANAYIPVFAPASEQQISQVPAASEADVLLAVDAAVRAQRTWRALPAIERGEHLRAFADALEKRAPIVGQALARESGKSLQDATNEAIYAAAITRYHAEWARRIEGEVIPSDSPNETILLQREPIGVVACLIPFNYPVYPVAQDCPGIDRRQQCGSAAQ